MITKNFNDKIPGINITRGEFTTIRFLYIGHSGNLFDCSNSLKLLRFITRGTQMDNSRKYYQLTNDQEMIWYTEKLYPDTSIGNNAGTVETKGESDYLLLEQAINILIENNEGLRLRIVEGNERPLQYISEYKYQKVDFYDFSQSNDRTDLERWEKRMTQIPFHLIDSDLFYFATIKITDQESGFFLKAHHLIADSWSMILMINQIVEYYLRLKNKITMPPEKRPSYLEHLLKEEEYKNSERFIDNRRFWNLKFETIPEFIYLKTYKLNYNNIKAERKGLALTEKITSKILKYCAEAGVSVFAFFLSILSIYISRIAEKQDLSLGTSLLNRSNAREKDTIGMFSNVVPVRVKVENQSDFRSFVQTITRELKQVLKNQRYPHNLILKDFHERHKTTNLYDITLTYQNARLIKNETGSEEFTTTWHSYGYQTNSLNVHIDDRDNRGYFILNFDYLIEVFSDEEIQQMYQHLCTLVEKVVDNPNQKISQLEILPEAEKRLLLFDFNDTKTDYPAAKTIHQLFEEQVLKTPYNIGVIFEDQHLTYRELNVKANQLAMVLREKGTKPDTIVGILAERSPEMFIGILSVLKAGGAYLPLDPEYPPERIQYMLEDSKAGVLLIDNGQLTMDNENLLAVINLKDEDIYQGEGRDLENINKPSDLAYVIYTSGSTGKPKGVMIEHQGIASLKVFFEESLEIKADDRIIQFASSSFDASVWEIFMSLLAGATLYIVPRGIIHDYNKFEEFLNRNKITVATLPPTYLANLNPEKITSLKKVIAAGSATTIDLYHKWKDKVEYINAYGPTETTICATVWRANTKEIKYNSVPIGKPIANMQVYIVDQNNNLQPIGIPGELCISGIGLARGYLNREELTAEKFVSNPFLQISDKVISDDVISDFGFQISDLTEQKTEGVSNDAISEFKNPQCAIGNPQLKIPQSRMYKTGDLARWLPDGNIEFLGRMDHQVKIRGFRIELGEIENQLLKIQSIKEAVVIECDGASGHKYLCAYLIANQELPVSEIRQHLLKELPDYMVPSFFIQLKEFPLTSSGKVDRHALPEPSENLHNVAEYIAPGDEIQMTMAAIWQEVLGVTKIGINDNFFELGGDSIIAILFLSKLHKHQLALELPDLFKHPTIGELSSFVKCKSREISQGRIEGEVELTPIQRWFFAQNFRDPHHWNQAVMLYKQDGFAEEIVRKVFAKIVEHHDALRMVYQTGEERVVQYNRGLTGELFHLKLTDVVGEGDYLRKIEDEANRLQGSFDLENGPLVNLELFKTVTGDHLLMVIHHLIVDGVSWRIILEDFATGYHQAINNVPIELPEKTDSYQGWATGLQAYAHSKELLQEVGYWKKLLATEAGLFAQTTLENDARVGDGVSVDFSLSRDETEMLLKNVNQAYRTEINDILLTALGLALKEWTGQEQYVINLEGHGREKIMAELDITRTVGWFTTTYPVLLDMRKSPDLSAQIKQIKEELRHIPKRGIGLGILKYLAPDEIRESLKFPGKPDLSFNYLGQFDQDLNTELFQISPLPTGSSISPNAGRTFKLEINGMISGGQLRFTLGYHPKEYRKETILKLMTCFNESLRQIIKHCQTKEEAELTPTDFGDQELSLEELEEITKNNAGIEKIYPLSPMQEGMLFSALKDQASRAYFEQISFSMEGAIEIELFEKSLNHLIERYENLRTVFVYQKIKSFRQVVLKKRPAVVVYQDISHLTAEEKRSFVEEFKRKDRENGFDLTKDSLMRMTVLRTGCASSEIIWSFHHIIMDGWCLGIVLKEVFTIYGWLKAGQPINLPEARPYSDYIQWLEKQDQTEGLLYWNRYLADYEQLATVPHFGAPSGTQKYQNQEFRFRLDESRTGGLINIARKNQVTLNVIIQSIWGILLQRYNNTNDVVFGAVVSGRPPELTRVERMVGLFVNTVPVRIKSDSQKIFSQLLAEVQEAALSSDKYNYLSLARIQSDTRLKQGLLDHLIAFENYPLEDTTKKFISGRETFGFNLDNIKIFEQTNYDFNVIVMPGQELTIRLIYNALIFDPNFITKIGTHFQEIAQRIIENDQLKIAEIEILTEAERRQILYDFNDTKADYPKDKTIHELFEKQVEKTPANLAIVFQNRKLTYRELNGKANQLARVLRNQGVGPDSIIGIMMERSPEYIISILGILKAGGACLPLDPEYPKQRVTAMLNDSGATILLTSETILQSKELSLTARVIFGDQIPEFPGQDSEKNLPGLSKPDNLVYVIYTSGSTGQPKGVMLEHRNLVNLISFEFAKTGIDFEGKVLQFANICFDVSFQEIFSTLLGGGELHLISQELKKELGQLFDYINDQKLKIIFLPTALFKIVSNEGFYLQKLPKTVEHIITAGEQLIVTGQFQRWLQENKVTLHNHYGPSETHVVTVLSLKPGETIPEIPPIGIPISNTQIYILDENLMVQPVGVAGELYIAGDNLGRGYLNRPDLTAERFVPNPFVISDDDISDFGFQISEFKNPQSAIYNPQWDTPQLKVLHSRMYRTGDLARWMPDGNIEFLGRLDQQVKIRGFRIELGEIESQILKYELIKEAVVVAREDGSGNKYLCAYVVCDQEQDLTEFIVELKEYLANNLPAYMMPSYFIRLRKMPLTSNGKIHYRALPEPQLSLTLGEYVPPGNEIEQKMAEIWASVLEVEKVGIHDNFFDIGGTSLNIFKVLAGAYRYNWDIAVQDFFRYPTIKQLSDKIDGSMVSCINNDEIENDNLATVLKKYEVKDVYVSGRKNNYKNVLLTGATGFLGSHLLNELLQSTQVNIYCLVRGNNKNEATKRLNDNLDFYFFGKYSNPVSNRIIVINGDITLEKFGLTEAAYHDLAGKIDNIIHAAAVAKNFGFYSEFERANVLGTKNAIDFSLVSRKKMDYISSLGIVGRPKRKENMEIMRYTENDFYIGQNYLFNPYIRSKFEAENLVFKAIKAGLSASIYRVGILSGRYSDGFFQMNINENTFYSILKTMIELGVISQAKSDAHIDITPVDCCSKAIVELSRMEESAGKVFHLINNNILRAKDLLKVFNELGIPVKVLDVDSYKKYVAVTSSAKNAPEIMKGAVNYNDEYDHDYKKWLIFDSEITREYLRHVNFEWPKVTAGYVKKLIEYMRKVGFIS
jgi:amino acid adenylation domain-containing protein/thioester reductase-like protein/non-ribosomal peptide synthase protein (TIGR01720 family)